MKKTTKENINKIIEFRQAIYEADDQADLSMAAELRAFGYVMSDKDQDAELAAFMRSRK